MSMTRRILRSWRAPRVVMRELLAAGQREDRAFAMLFVASLLIFVAQLPRLARQAHFDPSVPLDARIGGAMMGIMFLFPLFAYLIAAVSHLIARIFGGRGSFYTARVALFWSLLTAAPLMLLQGLVAGFIGEGPQAMLLGGLIAFGFAWHWGNALSAAESADAVVA